MPVLSTAAFRVAEFDSGELTVLAHVIHRFERARGYRGSIIVDDAVTGTFSLVVSDHAAEQVNIDLGGVDDPRAPYVGPPGVAELTPFRLRTGGYAVFYVSGSPARHAAVLATDVNAQAPAFDTRRLGPGDLFVVTPLRPGAYVLANTENNTRGEVVIDARGAELAPAPALEVTCGDAGFEPAQLSAGAGRAQVYHCEVPARVTLTPVRQ
jgi:hypothetical protein